MSDSKMVSTKRSLLEDMHAATIGGFINGEHLLRLRRDIGELLAAPAEDVRAADEPVAWTHAMHMELDQNHTVATLSADHPFGVCGKDFDPSYTVTTAPLYLRPRREMVMPERHAYNTGWNACLDEFKRLNP